MILTGAKLTFIGMGIVFIFLIILIYIIKLAARLLAKQTERELAELMAASRAKAKEREKALVHEDEGILVAVISAAGVSAVPMAARVAQKVGSEADPENVLIMHAMGPNVAGVLGSATAAGVLLGLKHLL